MFIKNAKAAGIRVGEDEIMDLTTGSKISPILANNPAFADESGAYSPEVLRDFVQNQVNVDETGKLKTFWHYLQNSVMVQKYYDKFNALMSNSATQPKLFLDRTVSENNTAATVSYVTIPFD